jgi:hypothetical protein
VNLNAGLNRMERTENDTRVIVTSGGTFCLFDGNGRLVGTIENPLDRQPVGAGRETVYLARPLDAKATVAA